MNLEYDGVLEIKDITEIVRESDCNGCARPGTTAIKRSKQSDEVIESGKRTVADRENSTPLRKLR